jgi:hypothetical protein
VDVHENKIKKEHTVIDLVMDPEKVGLGPDKTERKNGCPIFEPNESSSGN